MPQNEYSMMYLASLAGIDIPKIQLAELDKLENLPALNLPSEQLAYAIQRFDRKINNQGQTQRIHSEDFAQILVQYPHNKYSGGNYAQMARILYQYSSQGHRDVAQLARRLLVNILLANGDAHLKNWSVIYPDKKNPQLSPAYDIVCTKAYIPDEQLFALNLAKEKNWYKVNFADFEQWSKKSDVPWRHIQAQLLDVLDIARTQWHTELEDLPMLDAHKQILKTHWQNLHKDFRI